MDYIVEDNQVYGKDEYGKVVAKVTFPLNKDGVAVINHTFVDSSLRGQGVASQLLKKACEKIRDNNLKAIPTCSYAVEWFESHEDYRDVLKYNR